MKSIAELLQWGIQQLPGNNDAALEASILLAFVMGCSRVTLMTWPEKFPDPPSKQSEYEALIQRRAQGEPIAYLIGKKSFWHWDFMVTPDTLIPRPETELLIEQVLAHLPPNEALQVVDVGTGSGIIACTLAKERPHWQVLGMDLSQEALAIARLNGTQLQIPNVQWQRAHWCEGLPLHSQDALVSNPPYIAQHDPHLTQGDLRFEPNSALVAGPSGLEAYEALIPLAKTVLKPGGLIALEHGYDQALAIQGLLKTHGFTRIESFLDLAQHPRVTLGFVLDV